MMMPSYNFSTVNNVLPLGVQRAYVPRASRPHLAWVAPASPSASPHALGEHCRLKGDGTAARETLAAQEEREKDERRLRAGTPAATAVSSSSSPEVMSEVALRGLLTTDGATGTQLTLYHDLSAPGVPVRSSTVPSHRCVVALWAPSRNAEADEDPGAYLEGDVPLYVSDDVGNVFHHRWDARGGVKEPATKRHRGESEPVDAWASVAGAHSHLPSNLPSLSFASSSPSSELEALFTVARGAPGWAGLSMLSAGSSSDAPQLISVREFYHDVRVIDPVQHAVVRVYSTTHPPTGLLCPPVQAAPHCVLVTEGCLATMFDVRCPSAVLSLGEVYAAQEEWAAAKKAAEAEKLQQQHEERGESSAASSKGKHTSTGDSAAPPPPPLPPPLVAGRLTSTVGQVRDVCSTANPFEVACAVDRALCVYDLRKFNRLFTSSSVLKYVIGSVASVAAGRGIVCAGIDSEVRLVSLYDKTNDATQEATLSLAARAVAQSQKKQRSGTLKKTEEVNKAAEKKGNGCAASAPPIFDVDSMGPGGTFRTRLSTSVSCTSVWQGGWVSTQSLSGVAAVGVSVDGEVFLAQ
ncbi:hypothetical protein ABB37_00213 [Leptomonas pyrrhocoris]|uniref:Uncharacterized protein n=1 Tax=Leptomonas pyrrhocoris TaxID=157538 RepID=A0A0M9GA62_LEPPY|nr:hypothetical protein ABB37_00213 [Leptomonas pyrrhocoris]KPA85899.1 hypothetical protein ABB37_00213 [Leptomonas pyrrhocoris]|eukprot:XP_015664338.1 hypothetical protein ABB37_00213 [Leptomonas pyrrhocoris]